MKSFGYAGHIYPIHPSAPEVEGLKAYPSLGQTPELVDYAYVAIGAERIPDAIAQANGRCRIAQVISSGFAEVEEGVTLELALIESTAARVRVLGPNTLGTYSPRGGLTFPQNAPKAVGSVGIVAQSGGLSTDIIKRGEWRGLRFSGLVTIGNSADVAPHELVDYYLENSQTKVIGLYLEDIKNGRAFFDLLRSPKATKPVVILKGGRSRQGRLAAASHTGALAGDERAWEALPSQLPVAMVSTIDKFLDALLALQFLTPRPAKPTNLVTLFGNGGGSSVLGSDAFAAVGLNVSPFDAATRALLEALKLPPGTSVANPIDTPVRTLQEKDGMIAGEILDIVYQNIYVGEKDRRSLWRPKDYVLSFQHTPVRLVRASGDYISQYTEETRAAFAATPSVDFEFRQDEYDRHWATSIAETFEFHMRAFADPALDNDADALGLCQRLRSLRRVGISRSGRHCRPGHDLSATCQPSGHADHDASMGSGWPSSHVYAVGRDNSTDLPARHELQDVRFEPEK